MAEREEVRGEYDLEARHASDGGNCTPPDLEFCPPSQLKSL